MRKQLSQILSFSMLQHIFSQSNSPICGYAPLCGSRNETFVLEPDLGPNFPIEINGHHVIGGAEVQFTDCCSLRDTEPVRDCEVVNPTGSSSRFITSFTPICDSDPNNCEQGNCENYALAFRPTFIRSNQPEGCCDTCACYGDPECKSFSGEKNMWLLCDGREVPQQEDHWKRCRITKAVCDTQKDHAGNTCQYLASNKDGKGWSAVEKGSPCVPNPNSPPSIITMYEARNDNFKLDLTQGERGTILAVQLELNSGSYNLTALDCLTKNQNAWKQDSNTLPQSFHYTRPGNSADVFWNIMDPYSGIAVNIRCFGNDPLPGKNPQGVHVPRINVESLSDPIPNRGNTAGYCVTGEFNRGQATSGRTEEIERNQLCLDGLQNFTTLELYRAICKNPALPQSGIISCSHNFCSKYYYPLFESITACESMLSDNPAEGFCRAIVYVEGDVQECIDQWNQLGAIQTIQQYYNDREGCTNELPTSGEECQSGVTLQYQKDNGDWEDVIFIPEDYCAEGNDDNGQIVLTKCEHEELFTNPIRWVQTSPGANCAPVNQCIRIDGFAVFIAFGVPPTPQPTVSPTFSPTRQPTKQPTASPTNLPTKEPTPSPTRFPTVSPTGVPTPSPTVNPTPSPVVPSGAPTEANIPPTSNCEYTLCETPELYIDIEDDSFHTRMDSCCLPTIEQVCPGETPPVTVERNQGSNQAYCGDKYDETEPYKTTCRNNDKLTLKLMFSKDEDTKCCKTCTCYGDPRCVSFENVFDEYILCDGRARPESGLSSDRCVIRRDTCLQQLDHEGNRCAWRNDKASVPNFNDAYRQKKAENEFSVARYGSPCQYNPDISPSSSILLYKTGDIEIKIRQYDRGYIDYLSFKTSFGIWSILVNNCMNNANWTLEERYQPGNLQFSKSSFGVEKIWDVKDPVSGIEIGLRCTGVRFGNELVETFINVNYINEPDFTRAARGDGFCATGTMGEKDKATYQHSISLRNDGFCYNWNENQTNIMLRNAAREILDYAGLSTEGTVGAYTEFCTLNFSPQYTSITQCVNAFMTAVDVVGLINAFCRSITTVDNLRPCRENLEMISSNSGYQEAFKQGRKQYVETYQSVCNVVTADKILDALPAEETCKFGVELEYLDPVQGWKVYKAFPTDAPPCNGYMVDFTYREHPKLFEYPIRIHQDYRDTIKCNACTYISTVDAWFTFSSV